MWVPTVHALSIFVHSEWWLKYVLPYLVGMIGWDKSKLYMITLFLSPVSGTDKSTETPMGTWIFLVWQTENPEVSPRPFRIPVKRDR